MYQKILVPMALDHDISPKTLAVAKSLRNEGGEIIALHVHEVLEGSVSLYVDKEAMKSGFEQSKKLMDEKLAGIDDVKPKLVTGHTARTIIDFSDANGIECIVMGSHKPGLIDYFLGSTAAWVVRHANCAVHVHRERD